MNRAIDKPVEPVAHEHHGNIMVATELARRDPNRDDDDHTRPAASDGGAR